MGYTVEAIVAEDGSIRVEDSPLRPGTKVRVFVLDASPRERKPGEPGLLKGTGRVVGDIISPIEDWGEA